ncbi:MAG: T9SS type A sorting domain-containing protein, partial [Chitinophagaceae bacterium]|nr:T9SS type A sorting domain-containing protein [Chitinophagaceae bacterium]
YTVTGTDANGCINTATKTITVNVLPTVTATSSASAVCSGTSVTLAGVGASTYAWSGGVLNATSFIPTSTATYTVTGTDANGCINTATKTITVNALPTIQLLASSQLYCTADLSGMLSANPSGGVWSGLGVVGNSFNPFVAGFGLHTILYTYVDANGCSNSDTLLMTVDLCVGINEMTKNKLISVYPNPSRAQINLKVDVTLVGSIYIIYDNTGKIVMSGKINLKNSVIELGNLTAGVYLLNVGKNLKQTIKIIKE